MPELPEVETLKRQLERAVVGKTIAEVRVHNPRVIREPSPAQFVRGLTGATIVKVLRKAKLLILELSSGKALAIHLKMTGQLIFPGKETHARVEFRFSDGKTLSFHDQRLFAELRLVDDWRKLSFVQGLGPEPFDISAKQFAGLLARKKTKIKPFLLDQSFICGVGNVYAAESLFRSRINPTRVASSLSLDESTRLLESIQHVLHEAVRFHGSSIDNYVQLDGTPGTFNRFHQVYGREGKPCLVCKQPIQRIALGGRGTYFCPHCQNN